MSLSPKLLNMYTTMLDQMGPRGWWPAKSPFEVAVGAILTQNTAWRNVVKAIQNLELNGCLRPTLLMEMSESEIAELIRPSGYFRIKANRLKNFLSLIEYEATVNGCEADSMELECFRDQELEPLRNKLLAVKGIGPETADSILLYGLDLPVFVVDAYTARIMQRHGLIHEEAGYEELQELFMQALPADIQLFNEYHALLVAVGNGYCKKQRPLCEKCPLHVYFD